MPEDISINPGRFTDALTEERYPVGLGRTQFKNKREKIVAWLGKKSPDDAAAQALADKLEKCRPSARCKSPDCPECSKAAQNLLVRISRRFLKAHANINDIVWVTVVPADGLVAPGQLNADQHLRDLRRWKDLLGRAGVGWFIGGIDYSFNEHAENRYSPHWSKHFHGLSQSGEAVQQLKRSLQRYFPVTDVIPRPVTVAPWDGNTAAIRYVFKSDFRRRIGTDEGVRHDPRSGTERVCRDTDSQPLRSRQKRELLTHLDQIGIQGRLFLRCIQFMNLRGTGPTLVVRRSTRVIANLPK